MTVWIRRESPSVLPPFIRLRLAPKGPPMITTWHHLGILIGAGIRRRKLLQTGCSNSVVTLQLFYVISGLFYPDMNDKLQESRICIPRIKLSPPEQPIKCLAMQLTRFGAHYGGTFTPSMFFVQEKKIPFWKKNLLKFFLSQNFVGVDLPSPCYINATALSHKIALALIYHHPALSTP